MIWKSGPCKPPIPFAFAASAGVAPDFAAIQIVAAPKAINASFNLAPHN
jgi:hypothetical protein